MSNKHLLESHNFHAPKSCVLCSSYIWGKGLRCKLCRKFVVHVKCRAEAEALSTCGGPSSDKYSSRRDVPEITGIVVSVIEGRHITSNSVKLVDAFCKTSIGLQTFSSAVVRKNSNPLWNGSVEFDHVDMNEEIVFEVFHCDRFAYNEPLGLCTFSVAELATSGVVDRWLPFKETPVGGSKGEIHVIVKPVKEEALASDLSLAKAVRDGSVRAIVRLLRNADVDVNEQDRFGYTPLHTAVTMGESVLRPMLQCARVDVNCENQDENTALHYFCAKWRTPNCASLFQMFLNKGAKLNAQNRNGETPLHKAVMNGSVRLILVKLLVEHGADVNVLSKNGESAMHYAVHLKREDVILSLVQAGADVSVRSQGGKTAYGLAIELDQQPIARLLQDVRQLFEWLAELELDMYRAAFVEHEIFLSVLPALDDDTLDILKIKSLGHRMKLLEACAALRRKEEAGIDVSSNRRRRLTVNKTEAGLKMEAELAQLQHVEGAEDWLIHSHDLEFTGLIGEGASGSVYKGLYRDRKVAVKVVSAEVFAAKRLNEFKKEFEILATIRSPYTVHFYGASLEPQLCIVMEYAEQGSLFHVMFRPPTLPAPPDESEFKLVLLSDDAAVDGSLSLSDYDSEDTFDDKPSDNDSVSDDHDDSDDDLDYGSDEDHLHYDNNVSKVDEKSIKNNNSSSGSSNTTNGVSANVTMRKKSDLGAEYDDGDDESSDFEQPRVYDSLNWRWFFSIANDAVRGIDVLHSWQPSILHRDLKSLNLLVDGNGRAKLCDFGLSRFSTGSNLMSLQKCRGTLAYTAPEMMDAVAFQASADMYSLGMVLWEMATRLVKGVYERPYEEYPNLRLDFQILVQASQGVRPTIADEVPPPVAALIRRMWSADATQRPTAAELLVELAALRRQWQAQRDLWDDALAQPMVISTTSEGVHSGGLLQSIGAANEPLNIQAFNANKPGERKSGVTPAEAERELRRNLIRGVSAAGSWRSPNASPSAVAAIAAARKRSSPFGGKRGVTPQASPSPHASQRRSLLQRNERVRVGLAKLASQSVIKLDVATSENNNNNAADESDSDSSFDIGGLTLSSTNTFDSDDIVTVSELDSASPSSAATSTTKPETTVSRNEPPPLPKTSPPKRLSKSGRKAASGRFSRPRTKPKLTRHVTEMPKPAPPPGAPPQWVRDGGIPPPPPKKSSSGGGTSSSGSGARRKPSSGSQARRRHSNQSKQRSKGSSSSRSIIAPTTHDASESSGSYFEPPAPKHASSADFS